MDEHTKSLDTKNDNNNNNTKQNNQVIYNYNYEPLYNVMERNMINNENICEESAESVGNQLYWEEIGILFNTQDMNIFDDNNNINVLIKDELLPLVEPYKPFNDILQIFRKRMEYTDNIGNESILLFLFGFDCMQWTYQCIKEYYHEKTMNNEILEKLTNYANNFSMF